MFYFSNKNLLNSPGNFTASKLAWVKNNEPELYKKIYKIMLPGDYLSYKLSGEILSTTNGLSEGMFWDFKEKKVASWLLDYLGISESLIPSIVQNFHHLNSTHQSMPQMGQPLRQLGRYHLGQIALL